MKRSASFLQVVFLLGMSILPTRSVKSSKIGLPVDVTHNRARTSPAAASGTTERVSIASNGSQENDTSDSPAISGDGRYVAFASAATNLISSDLNDSYDIFVHDRQTDETETISIASDGSQGNNHSFEPSISAEGRYVAFTSVASNLVDFDTNLKSDIFVRDRCPDGSCVAVAGSAVYLPLITK